jgi:hypothetical protein
MSNAEDSLRYPIGKFTPQESYSTAEIRANIARIESVPQKIETVFKGLSLKQLETVYREGGWTARQVLHHVADSHMNAYIRIKWTLTEITPTIKAYDEKLWAETPEVKEDPGVSVQLLKALHTKFVLLLKNINEQDLRKEFTHPETKKNVSIERMIALYAWHGEHHLGHLHIIAAKPN